MKYTVEFVGVGRNNTSWSVSLDQMPTEPILERHVRKRGALMSRDIECVFDEDLEHGCIFAGMRTVGAFRVRRADQPSSASVCEHRNPEPWKLADGRAGWRCESCGAEFRQTDDGPITMNADQPEDAANGR